MKLALSALAALLFTAGLSSAQTFDVDYTATEGGSTYTFTGQLTGYLAAQTVEDQYDITSGTGTWTGSAGGTLNWSVLPVNQGISFIEYPTAGSGYPTTIPPQLYLETGNGPVTINGTTGTYSQQFGSGSFTEASSNLSMVSGATPAPWEPSDSVMLIGAAAFGLQQWKRLRSRQRVTA